MPRVALVLNTSGYRGPDFIRAADELGIDLVIAADGPLALASGRIEEVVPIDCDDPAAAVAAITAAAKRLPLDGVVADDDRGVVIAAEVAVGLGLPSNHPEAVRATRDKAVMRDLLASAGVAQPGFGVAGDREEAAVAAAGIGFPVVVKPVGLSASRGVIRADDPAAAAAAADRALEIVAAAGEGGPLLVEEFISGPEVAVEAVATPAGLEVLAVFDKPDPLEGPFFEETIYTTPSRHPAAEIEEVVGLVEQGVAALGLSFGPVHGEARITPRGPILIEVAARSIGGLCGRSLRFGMLRQSLEHLLLRAALSLPRRGMDREDAAAGAMMLPIPEEGVLRSVRGREAVAEVEGITGLEITIPLGKRVVPLPEGDRYLGFLFAAGDDPTDVEAAMREAHSLLDFEIEPD